MNMVLDPGAYFGESALVGERCCRASVTAMDKSRLLQLSAKDVQAAGEATL